MVYAFPGAGALDYSPCHYGGSRLTFRGPPRATNGVFVACLGGTEAYGKFVPRPFPDLVEAGLGLPVANLACANAGPDAYLAEEGIIALAGRAQAVILQLSGAQNLSNRYYAVHPRRNDRFLGATPLLRGLFREIDFTEFTFTRHLLTTLQAASAERFELVAAELRAAWVSRMQLLLARLACPVILLWMADPPPPSGQRADLGREPVLVDAAMLSALRQAAHDLVMVPPSAAARSSGCDGMAYGPLEGPAAARLPGPLHHAEAAAALLPVLERLM